MVVGCILEKSSRFGGVLMDLWDCEVVKLELRLRLWLCLWLELDVRVEV